MRQPRAESDSRRLLVHQDKAGNYGVAVGLYRKGSGGNVVNAPSERWIANMKKVAALNYGEISIIMRPSLSPGYNNEYGCIFFILPGSLKGDVGDGTPMESPINANSLPLYCDFGHDPRGFEIATNLADAEQLYKQLGKVLLRARKMTKRVKNKK